MYNSFAITLPYFALPVLSFHSFPFLSFNSIPSFILHSFPVPSLPFYSIDSMSSFLGIPFYFLPFYSLSPIPIQPRAYILGFHYIPYLSKFLSIPLIPIHPLFCISFHSMSFHPFAAMLKPRDLPLKIKSTN